MELAGLRRAAYAQTVLEIARSGAKYNVAAAEPHATEIQTAKEFSSGSRLNTEPLS